MKCTCTSMSPGSPRPRHQRGTSPSRAGTAASGTTLSPASQLARDLPAGLPLGERRALVVRPPPTRERDLHFRSAVLEIQGQRDEREPAFLRLADQPLDL